MSDAPEQLRVAYGLEQLPQAQWQALVQGRPALRLEVLQALIAGSPRPLPVQAFLLEDAQGLAAAALCEPVLRRSSHNHLDAVLFGRSRRAARGIGISSTPVLLFKSPFARVTPLVVRPGSITEQQRLIRRLLDEIDAYAAAQKLGIAFIGVTADDELLCTELLARRYLDTPLDATARLEVEWEDFDGYVKHLRKRSKSAAQNARTERTRNQKSGVTIAQVQADGADLQGLYQLAREHYRHKNGFEPVYGPEFLPMLRASIGSDLMIFEAMREGERVAMLALVRSGSIGWVAFIGIALRDRPNDFTYANLLFYYAADWAPACGIRTLLYGTAAESAKIKRGCYLIASRLFYRPCGHAGRLLAKSYFVVHQSWQRWKSRSN